MPSSASHQADPPSRRSFLQTFAGSVTLAATTPLAAVAVVGDLYVNHRVGLAFRRPAGWKYEHLQTFADIRNEYEYATADPELLTLLKQGPLPAVVVSQTSVLRSLGSSITVYMEENPLEPSETLASISHELIRGVSGFVKDFRLLGKPAIGRVSGREALEYYFTFQYQDRLGNSGPVRHRTLSILGQSLLYSFNMLDIPADRIDSQAEFDSVRQSIVLA
ncbi:MAG: hypothetical protein IPJ99_02620 [Betaproteobacteria bacterium]|nr:hypothetical protein [Betaproteobacteria bacterium]MBK8917851.1 hypothetical protein [Betaproteobacteria bacterium]